MTAKRDLKNRIRERQERTGERYTTARAAVLAQKDLVIELREAPPHPGILCSIRVSPALWGHEGPILDQLREILLGPTEELEPMRRAVLHGKRDRSEASAVLLVTRLREFRTRLQQGLRGPGPGGRMLAFDSGGRTIIVQLFPRPDGQPLLLLSQFGESALEGVLDSMALWLGWRR
jgi:hypothetical protein